MYQNYRSVLLFEKLKGKKIYVKRFSNLARH